MKYSKEIKIGFFAILVLAATFFAINYLRGKDIFNKEIELSARFKSADGLVASAPVHIKGFSAGSVSSIRYDRETDDFEVVCSVSKEFKIPVDSKMTIYSTSIMGGKGIRIDCGSSEELAGDGSVLQGDSQPDLVETVSAGIGPLMEKLEETVAGLRTTIASVNGILSEENRKNIDRALKDLKKVLADAASVTGTIKDRNGEIDSFISDLSSISGKLAEVVEKADTAMQSVSSITDKLDKADLDSLVISVKRLSDSIQNPEGTVGKLLNEASIYDTVDSLVLELNDLVKKIKEDPKKYLKISVF
ncbi:MAG: MlaD family protein [Candidatus Cryptobacteroides sp.]